MKKRYFLILPLILLLLLLIPGLSQKLQVNVYRTESDKLADDVRFAVITDLHNSFYGRAQEQLIAAIDEAGPDAILISGDLADSLETLKAARVLIGGLGGRYPIYYASGNHECAIPENLAAIKQALREMGVQVLEAEGLYFREDVWISGLDNSYRYPLLWEEQLEKCKNDGGAFAVLLSHAPDKHAHYGDFDLTVCGHAHGGQVRLFGRAIWAPGQGLLPRYTSGLHAIGRGEMFVSRGLAKNWLPRVFNRPELAIIEVNAI